MGNPQWCASKLIGEFAVRNIMELNINEYGRSTKRISPSLETVKMFEEEFRVSLPPEFVQFLGEVNGGHPELDSFVLPGSDENNRFAVDYFYHLTDNEQSSTTDIWWAMRNWGQVLGGGCVPIACDGGGNQVYIDCNNQNFIFLCLHDEGFKKAKVAESFSEFLDLLEKDLEMI